MLSLKRLIFATCVVFLLLQFVRPGISSKPATSELVASPQVRGILVKDCYSCHSDERRLLWFDEVVPTYWLVRHDVLTAREHLNFSTLGSKRPTAQRAALYEAVNMIQLGAMSPQKFTALHPDAKVTPEELSILKAYLAPWSLVPPNAPVVNGVTETTAERINLSSVNQELNGLAFDPSFETWKPISFTDRGDNNTFRFILGNEIAVQAAQSGNISPWPDGAKLAKIAWQQESGSDSLIHPGRFVQVEFMVKGSHTYKQTEGWGWGRWRGLDLKPYGKDAHLANECIGCHMPVRRDDNVYTLPISRAKTDKQEALNNHAAALPGNLPYQPLAWSAITMYVDPRSRTMATLYGNDAAMQAVLERGASSGKPITYPPGSVLALVTWNQRDDPHWFGGRVPDAPRSLEFVKASTRGADSSYQLFEGAALAEQLTTLASSAQRASFISNLVPAALP